MNGVMKLAFYLALALIVAYVWVHFEAPTWNPFRQ